MVGIWELEVVENTRFIFILKYLAFVSQWHCARPLVRMRCKIFLPSGNLHSVLELYKQAQEETYRKNMQGDIPLNILNNSGTSGRL